MAGEPGDAATAVVGVAAPSGAVVEVSWPDIVRLVDRDPRLSAGQFLVEAARGGLDAAGAVPNPTLEGTVGQGSARTGGAARLEWGLGLTMPLGWLAQRGARVDAAVAQLDVALAERRALRRDVLLRLRTMFWRLAYERARVTSLAQLEMQTAALVQTVKKRVERGAVRPIEATRVEIELEKVTSELESARSSLAARAAELTLWLGLPAGGTLVPLAQFEALSVAPKRDTALARARATHPVLAVARAKARLLEAELGAEKMARVPALSLSGVSSYEIDRRSYGLGVAVDLPLWNWNSGRVAAAEAKLAAGRMQAEAADLEVGASTLEAQAACAAAVVGATRFGSELVPRAEIVAATMERTYQLGEASLLEVIDARRTLLDARGQYLRALVEAQIDCSRLGALLEEEPK